MLSGCPQFSAGEVSTKPLDVKKEADSEEGIVLATQMPAIEHVHLSPTAALRIVKHSRDFAPHKVFGNLLGIQVGNTVEVTSALPSIQTSMYEAGDLSEDQRDAKDQDDQEAALKHLRESGMGGLQVGSYAGVASSSSYFATPSIRAMMRGVAAGNPCLMIVYDPVRTQLGKLYLRAFTPSVEYYTLMKAIEKGEKEHTQRNNFKEFLREVPIEFTTSTLSKMVLHDEVASKSRNVRNAIVEQGGVERYSERNLQNAMEGLEKLRGDLVHHSYSNADGQHPALKMETRALCQQLAEQGAHVAGVAKGTSLNLHFAALAANQ